MNVFDASALLAFLQGDEGAERTEGALKAGGACGAATWSEIAQTVRAHGRNWDLARSLLASYGLRIESVTAADAEWGRTQMGARRGPLARRPAVPGTR